MERLPDVDGPMAGGCLVEEGDVAVQEGLLPLAAAIASLTPAWYALRVRAKSESVAEQALMRNGFAVYAPLYEKKHAFPGYLFARFALREKAEILSSPRVLAIVTFAGKPTAIPEPELEAVRLALSLGAKPLPALLIGRRVRVIRGPLTGVEGELVGQQRHELVLAVWLVQRAVSLKIDPADVQPI